VLFNSIEFIFFFPIVTSIYFLLPHKFRWFMLLISSCIFYMAFIPSYILILFVTIIVDYLAAILIENSEGSKKKFYLIISIVSTCLILFIFKYFNFFSSSLEFIVNLTGIEYKSKLLDLILPIGLSFHTFQSLSYVIEVYRGKQKAEKHFGIYSLYVMFYPQLVAGPIERPQNLLHQFREFHKFDYDRVTDGLKLMLFGMFKKVVIADRLSVFVNQVYSSPTSFEGPALVMATIFFAFQIYYDFSGYSDIAIGSAKVMGFDLMKNFDRPYFSKSISEFWTRWHISLSTWFKDYLYISLGGNRVSAFRWQFNLFFTFLISGLWHGANWTYVIWGMLNGFYLVFSIWTFDIRNKIEKKLYLSNNKIYKIIITFSLICFSWIFFRAKNVSDAIYIVSHLFTGFDNLISISYIRKTISEQGNIKTLEFIIACMLLIGMEIIHLIQRKYKIRDLISKNNIFMRWSIYYLLILSIIFLGVFNKNDFIYFQF
jgi:alginate O-acetyltransferase complex protein AlgI